MTSAVSGPRINERIRAREVRVIGPDGEQIGVVPLAVALDRAGDAGLDLVEVAPQADPPVCRILDYGKYRYQLAAKEKLARRRRAAGELKPVRLQPNPSEHDLLTKVRQIRRFLERGHRVRMSVRFRGPQRFHPERGRMLLERIRDELSGVASAEDVPRMDGRLMVMTLTPKR